MRMNVVTELSEAISGTSKKTGKSFQGFKVHDEAAKEYVMVFVDAETFDRYRAIEPGTPVQLVLDVKLGTPFYSLVSLEILED